MYKKSTIYIGFIVILLLLIFFLLSFIEGREAAHVFSATQENFLFFI